MADVLPADSGLMAGFAWGNCWRLNLLWPKYHARIRGSKSCSANAYEAFQAIILSKVCQFYLYFCHFDNYLCFGMIMIEAIILHLSGAIMEKWFRHSLMALGFLFIVFIESCILGMANTE